MNADLEGEMEGMENSKESDKFLGPEGAAQPLNYANVPMCACLTIPYYQPYFNIDTSDVVFRVSRTVMLWKEESFLNLVAPNPDAYGPFWISTSLVFLVAVTSHINSWIGFKGDNWQYDFTSVIKAASIIYGAAAFAPAALWGLSRQYRIPLGFPQYVCLYGYSLALFLPVTLICLAPYGWLSWLAVLLGSISSAAFLIKNMAPLLLQHSQQHATTILVAIGGLQLLLGLLLKVLFYWH